MPGMTVGSSENIFGSCLNSGRVVFRDLYSSSSSIDIVNALAYETNNNSKNSHCIHIANFHSCHIISYFIFNVCYQENISQ